MTTIADLTRTEAILAGRRLAATNELSKRRLHDPDDARHHWATDPWAAVCAELGAAMGISPRRASGQLLLTQRLRDRLPATAALLDTGAVSLRTACPPTGPEAVDCRVAHRCDTTPSNSTRRPVRYVTITTCASH